MLLYLNLAYFLYLNISASISLVSFALFCSSLMDNEFFRVSSSLFPDLLSFFEHIFNFLVQESTLGKSEAKMVPPFRYFSLV